MDLDDNIVKRENLVVIKEGVELPQLETDEFKRNTFYRSIGLYSDNDCQILVNGVAFDKANFEKYFEYVQDLMLREFEQLGVIVNGKIISKKAFKEICHVNQYGRTSKSGFKIAYICTHPKELMYVFMPFFIGDTKAESLNCAYRSVRDIIEGNMDCVNEYYVQRTNTGLPLSMRASHRFDFRDTTNDVKFVL